jgi:hypothetical protein
MTTRPDFHLRPFVPELLPQVAGLLRHLWSPNVARNQRVFEWKYHENPQAASTPGIVALLAGRVVGFRGYFVTALLGPGRSEPIRILCHGQLGLYGSRLARLGFQAERALAPPGKATYGRAAVARSSRGRGFRRESLVPRRRRHAQHSQLAVPGNRVGCLLMPSAQRRRPALSETP